MENRAISLRVSVTDLCQLRCLYCMPADGIEKHTCDEILRFEEIVRCVHILKSNFQLAKVHLTGGEPLIRRGIVDLVDMLARAGLDDLALTTNGQSLGSLAHQLKAAGLRRVNVSLNSLKPDVFRQLSRGGELGKTLDGLEAAEACGLAPIKLNVVVLRHLNSDEIGDIAAFGLRKDMQIRFLELMPIGPAAKSLDDWFVSSAEVYQALSETFDLRPIPDVPGGSSRQYQATDRQGRTGTLGFISSQTDPFCGRCTRLRLTSTGQLLGCLARGEGPDLRDLLRCDDPSSARQVVQAVRDVLALKQTAGTRLFTTTRPMVTVGG